jgi:hypothetical protein
MVRFIQWSCGKPPEIKVIPDKKSGKRRIISGSLKELA